MSAGRLIVRPARPRDILRFSRFVMPRFVGYVAEDEEGFAGMGAIIWGEQKKPFICTEIAERLRGKRYFLHRNALWFMTTVAPHFDVVYAQASSNEPTSLRWLKRLGFEETDETMNGERVLTWRRSSQHSPQCSAAASAAAGLSPSSAAP